MSSKWGKRSEIPKCWIDQIDQQVLLYKQKIRLLKWPARNRSFLQTSQSLRQAIFFLYTLYYFFYFFFLFYSLFYFQQCVFLALCYCFRHWSAEPLLLRPLPSSLAQATETLRHFTWWLCLTRTASTTSTFRLALTARCTCEPSLDLNLLEVSIPTMLSVPMLVTSRF